VARARGVHAPAAVVDAVIPTARFDFGVGTAGAMPLAVDLENETLDASMDN
jgi:hypothetical protein